MSLLQLKNLEVWFITGSQHLYGKETLQQVSDQASVVASFLDQHNDNPVTVVFKPIVTTAEEITAVLSSAQQTTACIGVIVWMHTFSPAKMWINGIKQYHKPLLHLHTQYNRDIPWSDIDMNFMNLNQSAHGDREFGFLLSQMRRERKVVVGHWLDKNVLQQIHIWCRAAAAWADWQGAKFVRFGDNMRDVAVTEGNKVAAEVQFGFSVNTFSVNDLAAYIQSVKKEEADELVNVYLENYQLQNKLKKEAAKNVSLCDAAAIEIGLRRFLTEGGFKGYTNTFEDLHGLKQLPGIATQRLMADGFGFGAEGDWKTAALLRAMKTMAAGLPGGNSFMEDYTYHFETNNEMVLGAHMLEICPSIAEAKPICEVHPLSIGGKEDPVRLVFDVKPGVAINVALMDMGNRFRMLVNELDVVKAPQALPKLPVARALWKPLPDMATACAAWIYGGGAHHTVFSQNLSADYLYDFAEIAGIEMLCINKHTKLPEFKQQIRNNEITYNNYKR